MFPCLKKKPKPEISRPTKPPEKPIQVGDDFLVAWVEGHTWKKPGARNYLKECEKPWSNRIGSKVMAKVADRGYRMVRIERPEGSYSSQCRYVADKAEDLGVTHSLHSHFNAASSPGKGGEGLVPPTSTLIDDLMADMFTDLLNKRLGFKERHEDGIKRVYKGHNGYTMLDKVSDKGVHAIILEPTFAHYRHAESIAIFENEDAYVDIIVELIVAIYEGKLRDLDED